MSQNLDIEVNIFEYFYCILPARQEIDLANKCFNENNYEEAIKHLKNCLNIYLNQCFDNRENIENIRMHHYENLLNVMNFNVVNVLNNNRDGEDMEAIKKAFKDFEETLDNCQFEEIKEKFQDKRKNHEQFVEQRELKKFFKEEKYEEILSKIDNNINNCIPGLGDNLKNSLIEIKDKTLTQYGQKLLKENKIEQIKELLVKYPILSEKFKTLRNILNKNLSKKNNKDKAKYYEGLIKSDPNNPKNYSKKKSSRKLLWKH